MIYIIPVLEVQKTNYFFRQILILDNSIQFGMEALFPPIPNQRIDQFNWSSFGGSQWLALCNLGNFPCNVAWQTAVITLLDLHRFWSLWLIYARVLHDLPCIILMMPIQFGMQNLCTTLLNQPKKYVGWFLRGLCVANSMQLWFTSSIRFVTLHLLSFPVMPIFISVHVSFWFSFTSFRCNCFHLISLSWIYMNAWKNAQE